MATPEELQAELDRVKTELAASEAKVKTAASIQRAFNNLRDSNPDAAKYLEDLAASRPAQPFWEQAASTAEVDPDVDTGAALRQLEERLTAQFEQRTQQLLALQDQKFNSVANPVLQMRAESAQKNVKAAFDAQYGEGKFDEYRSKAAELAAGNDALLQDENGLTTLLNAAIAPDLIGMGREQIAAEKAQRNEMANSIFGGPTPGASKGGSEDEFDDLDWKNDPEGAFEAAFDRA